jgi:glycosyltransferase involved in cell wall biosynthesis
VSEGGPSRPRLACYGWVDEKAGSVASGGYLALRELLRRGVQVDLFAHAEHVPCPEGLVGEGFRYFGLEQPAPLTWVDSLPSRLGTAVRLLFEPAVAAAWRRAYRPVVEAEHRRAPYDAVFVLGTLPAFTIPGVPTVAWLQAPLHTELAAIRRLRPQIASVSGRAFYLALVTLSRYSLLVRRRNLAFCDRLILGSEWSLRAAVAAGFSSDAVHVIPYPIDLELFRPDPEHDLEWERPMLLSLGRLDPRKRLDLLLEAFGLVRETAPGARLRIVGRPGYAPNQLSLIERCPHRGQVEYRPEVPREQVPSLLRETAVLVQPSENENFGSAVAEALACGVPVVVGPSNGTADYLDANSAIFEAYAPDSVARAILRTFEARRERPDDVRRSARARAERWFAASAIADQLLRVIDAAIEAARVRPPVSSRQAK